MLEQIQAVDTIPSNNQVTSTIQASGNQPFYSEEVVVVQDPGMSVFLLIFFLAIFLIWFAILNIGLQKIGVSVPRVLGNVFKNIRLLFKPKSQ